jgi:ABC-type transporter Mla MlaB component
MKNTAETTGELRLSGPLVLRHAADLRQSLLDAVATYDHVILDIPDDCIADISVVQLLVSAQVSASAGGKQISLKKPSAGVLRDVLEQGGFLASDNTGFWTRGVFVQ